MNLRTRLSRSNGYRELGMFDESILDYFQALISLGSMQKKKVFFRHHLALEMSVFIIPYLPVFSLSTLDQKYSLASMIEKNGRFVLFAIHPVILF